MNSVSLEIWDAESLKNKNSFVDEIVDLLSWVGGPVASGQGIFRTPLFCGVLKIK
jgi:hypothetical protein